MELVDKITKLVQDKGVTPYQISIETGVSQATLSKIMDGSTKKLSNKTAESLSKYFGIDKEILMQNRSNADTAGYNDGGNVVNNSGDGNHFTQKVECSEVIKAKDELISQLRGEVEYLRNLTNTIMNNK